MNSSMNIWNVYSTIKKHFQDISWIWATVVIALHLLSRHLKSVIFMYYILFTSHMESKLYSFIQKKKSINSHNRLWKKIVMIKVVNCMNMVCYFRTVTCLRFSLKYYWLKVFLAFKYKELFRVITSVSTGMTSLIPFWI